MKAAVLEAIGQPMVIDDIEVAAPTGREVLIEVKANGLCHSDLHMAENNFGTVLPAIFGHELAGIVTEVGPLVTQVAVGDHVVGCLVSHCGACEKCLAGRTYECRNRAATARAKGEAPRLSRRGEAVTQGFSLSGFAEQTLVHENNIVKITKDIPFDKACLLGCGVVTGAGAVINSARTRVGDTVAVIGCGGVGLSAIQGARLAGARRIVAVDLQPGKLELALKLGATDVVNPNDGDAIEQVKALTGGYGVDHAFEVIGLKDTAMQAFNMLATGGTAYLIGIQKPGTVFELPGGSFLGSQRALRGVYMGSTNFKVDVPMFADYYLQGRFKLDELVSQTIPLDQVNEGYEELKKGEVARSVVVF
jgi:S-(hydroxymethyl)glutathione dehydrogenase/alcohol dehydrogenase